MNCTYLACMQVAYPSEWPEWCQLDGLQEDTFMENYKKTEKCRVSFRGFSMALFFCT